MTIEIRGLRSADERQTVHSGDEALDLLLPPLRRAERFGFVPLQVLEGGTAQRPEPTPMFVALGPVPPRR